MSRHYFPSNGSEGMAFMNAWCESCSRDTQLRGGRTYCTILTGSMVRDNQPKQWIYDENNEPTCTSFRKVGSITKPKIRKSEKTLNIFDENKPLSLFETELLQFKTEIK